MRKTKRVSGDIPPVRYSPPADYGLDLEIFPASVLRRRTGVDLPQLAQRIEFHLLMCVTGGHCVHMADFESIACKPGSMLVLRPGQVQRFDAGSHWQGWLVIFRPEFLQPRDSARSIGDLEVFHQLDELPVRLTLKGRERSAVEQGITRMYADARINASAGVRHALLRGQLQTLLMRLHLAQMHREQAERIDPVSLQRFKRYRLSVDSEFHRRHRVVDYAALLGCSEKSLAHAAWEVAGVSAKTFLSRRIALEAKRLLAHTTFPISVIADKLGFDEATNFVKFFRREAGMSPGDFRKRHAVAQIA